MFEMKRSGSKLWVPVFGLAVVLLVSRVGSAQTLAVQIPFGSAAAGIAPSTYSGTTAGGSVCTGALDTSGDGCPATQATLTSPVALAVDSQNNAYIAQLNVSAPAIRVLYQAGSALASALQNANPSLSFTPATGYIYGFNAASASLPSHSGVYYCTGSSGQVALDSIGDGCPAAYAKWQAVGVQVDAGGNIFMLTSNSPTSGVKVIYVGGGTTAQNAAAANLIKSYNPTVTTPCSGCIYSMSVYTSTTSTDFIGAYDIAIDSNENLYVADKGTYTTGQTGVLASTSGSQVKKYVTSPTAGWVTYVPEGAANVAGADGDGGPAGSATVSAPRYLLFDANNNLYIADWGNSRVRVVYNSGSTPPLYVNNGTTPTAVSTPTVGNIYTVTAGQANGASRSPGTAASLLYIPEPQIGLDRAGNLYVDNPVYYSTFKINSATGVATLLGGGGASTTTGSANTTPGAGAYCNNGTRGPKMTDAYADGCPATQINGLGLTGRIGFDSLGNMYELEEHTASDPVGLLRKFSYSGQYGTVPVGSTSTQTLAFMPIGTGSVYTSTPVLGLVASGNATSEFTDAGNDVCTTTTTDQTCIYNVNFTPALAGPRQGGLTLTYSGATVVTTPLGGVGGGSQISLDPGTQTTIGTGLSPTGVAVDQSGNFYIADGTTNNVFKSTGGAAPVSFATGFSSPKQVALSGAGTVYVADSGNNRIAAVTQAGVVSTFAASNNLASYTLTAPFGVAVDGAGNVYIADTGNNRVLEVTGGSTIESNVVTVLGFTGLSSPRGLAVDATGNVFVADSGNARVVELSAAGVQSTVTVSPSLATPVGVSVDPAGDLFIADATATNVVLVPYGTTTATTLLGNTIGVNGLATDNTGNLAISASTTTGILLLNRTQIAYTFPPTNLGSSSSPTVLTLSDTGNIPLSIGSSLGSSTDSSDFAITSASTNGCSVNQNILIGSNCMFDVTFQPQSKAALVDVITFPTSNAINYAQVLLKGSGVQEVPTTTALSYSTSPTTTPQGGLPLSGQAFTLTASISLMSNVGPATGTVRFTVDGNAMSPVNVAAVGNQVSASVSLTLTAGAHTIGAVYSGDTSYEGSTAGLTIQCVAPATSSLVLSVSPASPKNSTPFTVTAQISSSFSQGPISGSVTFTVDGVVQPVAPLVNASVSITLIQNTGPHVISAAYGGNSYYLSSTGNSQYLVIPNGTSAVALAIVSPSGTITFGQSVVISATITNGNNTVTPTGTVSFYIDNKAQNTVPYSSVVSTTFAPGGGVHTISASYSGDNQYAPSTGTLNITVSRAQTATALQAVPVTSTPSNYITLNASVTSSIPITPTGTIAYMSGSSSLGTGQLISGGSSINTSANAVSYTAAYSGDSNYLPSSTSVTPTPVFAATTSTSLITVPQNAVGTLNVNVSSFFGYSGSIRLSCTGLPANTTCGGSPTLSAVAANSIQPIQLQIVTDASPLSTAALNVSNKLYMASTASLAILIIAGFPLPKRRRILGRFVLSILLLVATEGMSSCASDTSSNSAYLTPIGTYPIVVSATDGALISSSNVSLTVIAGNLAGRP